LEVQPSAGDAFDTDWGALTKPMQIEAFDLSFIVSAATRREPLVSALNAWVRSSWPGQPSIDDVQPHDRIPPVFWRVQDRPAVLEMTNAVTWLQVRLRAHILCASPSDRVLWTRRVTEALVLKREVLLPDGGCLYFDGVGADSEQHPATAGQIILTGRYAVEVQERKFPVVETIETSVTTGG
jgi:hypothetical protein